MRMSKLSIRPVIFMLIMVVSGCSAVFSPEPIGQKPVQLQEKDWNGMWFDGETVVTIRVKDSEKGLLELAWIEGGSSELHLEAIEAVLKSSGEWTFISARDEQVMSDEPEVAEKDKADEPRYLWARIDKDGHRIMMWLPNPEVFEKLVTEGILPGKVIEDGILLKPLKSEHIEIIGASSHGVVFGWDEPIVLVKLAD